MVAFDPKIIYTNEKNNGFLINIKKKYENFASFMVGIMLQLVNNLCRIFFRRKNYNF